jgi:hypothetical protein
MILFRRRYQPRDERCRFAVRDSFLLSYIASGMARPDHPSRHRVAR